MAGITRVLTEMAVVNLEYRGTFMRFMCMFISCLNPKIDTALFAATVLQL